MRLLRPGVRRSLELQGLDPTRAAQLGVLFAALSDADLRVIAPAIAAVAAGSKGEAVDSLLKDELADRRVRDRVFAPLAPLVRRPCLAQGHLPPASLSQLWRRLKAERGELVEQAWRDLGDSVDPRRAIVAADALTHEAAELLGRDVSDTAVELRRLVVIAPLIRSALPRMRSYLRTASDADASALRLAYRDAAAIDEEAPPRLIDVLSSHLDSPWLVLRLICAVMDRPEDHFLAGSELGRFAERALDELDLKLRLVRGLDADAGAAEGEAAAAAVCAAVTGLAEFDRSIEVGAAGLWAKRLTTQRRNLARSVEAWLRQGEAALARALPVIAEALPGQLRGGPNLDIAFDAKAAERLRTLIAFAAGVRGAADGGGFSVARSRAVEALDRALSLQADALVEAVHENADPRRVDEARLRLALVGDALGRLRDGRAAEVVRRRAAAA